MSCKLNDVDGSCTGVSSISSVVLPQNIASLATHTSTPPQNKTDSSSTAEKVPPAALKQDESLSGSYYTAEGSGKTINSTGDRRSEPDDSIERDGPPSLIRGDSFVAKSVPLSFSYPTVTYGNGQPTTQPMRELEHLSSTESPILQSVEPDDYLLQSRLSPVVFFDRMDQMATAVSGTPPHTRSRANSDISVIISHLISTEEAAPTYPERARSGFRLQPLSLSSSASLSSCRVAHKSLKQI